MEAEPLAPRARAAPEERGSIGEAQVREIEDRGHRLHRHVGADLHPLGLVTVAEEAGSTRQLDEGDVQRRAEPLGGECSVVNETTSPSGATPAASIRTGWPGQRL